MQPNTSDNSFSQPDGFTNRGRIALQDLECQSFKLSHRLRSLILNDSRHRSIQLSDLDVFIAANNGISDKTNYIIPEPVIQHPGAPDRLYVTAQQSPVLFQHIIHLQEITGRVKNWADIARLSSASLSISRESAMTYFELLQDAARSVAQNRDRLMPLVAELFALRTAIRLLEGQCPFGTIPPLVRIVGPKDGHIVTACRGRARRFLHACPSHAHIFLGGAGVNALAELPVMASMSRCHFHLNDADPFVAQVFANVLRNYPVPNVAFTAGSMGHALSQRTSIDLAIISDISQPLTEEPLDIAPALTKALKPGGQVYVAQSDQRGRPGGVHCCEWEGAFELSGYQLAASAQWNMDAQLFNDLEHVELLALSGKEILAAHTANEPVVEAQIPYRAALYSKKDMGFSGLTLPATSPTTET